MKIGVFDSGVGGLSILSHLQHAYPKATYDYCCDHLHFPYGTKSEDELIPVITDVCSRFAKHAQLDLLVIACNTASTVALQAVRAAVTCPVVGVVPAIKPAATLSKTKCIGVLATQRAVAQPYLQDLIREHASDCIVKMWGSSRLVQLAERKMRGESLDLDEVKHEISNLFVESAKKMDVVVLGCTHFPLLRQELAKVAPWPVTWIDSGEAIARRVQQICLDLTVHGQQSESTGYTTGTVAALWGGQIPQAVQAMGLINWKYLP